VSADRRSDLGSEFEPAGATDVGSSTLAARNAGKDGDDLDAQALRALAEDISRQFVPQLEHTALVLYDRDPGHLQAQWYITPEEIAQARSLFPNQGTGLQQVLRLRRLDQDGRAEVVASAVQGSGDSKGEGLGTFTLQPDGAEYEYEYECELGLESGDGGWLVVARSNRIALPGRSIPPPRIGSEIGATRDREREGSREPPGSPQLPVEPALAAVGEPLYPVFPNLELEEASPTEGFSPPLEAAPGQVRALEHEPETPPSMRQHPARDGGTPPPAPLERDLDRMPPPLLPSTPEPGRPPELLGAHYDPRAAFSSAALRGASPPRLDVEIQAELIVRGHVSPGSKVELFGQSVQVGDDGRFCVRRPVEDLMLLSLAVVRHPESGKGHRETE